MSTLAHMQYAMSQSIPAQSIFRFLHAMVRQPWMEFRGGCLPRCLPRWALYPSADSSVGWVAVRSIYPAAIQASIRAPHAAMPRMIGRVFAQFSASCSVTAEPHSGISHDSYISEEPFHKYVLSAHRLGSLPIIALQALQI